MRLCGLFLSLAMLSGCGSGQPSGDLSSCTGTVDVKEDNSTPQFGSVKYLGGTAAGQYMRFRTAMTVSHVWMSAYTNSATSFIVSIYKNHTSDSMPAGTQPVKQFTVTEFNVLDSSENLWLKLPGTFTFPATTAADDAEGLYYFVSVEPVGGTLVFGMSSRGDSGRIRRGYREGSSSSGAYGTTASSTGFGFGFRGIADCLTEK